MELSPRAAVEKIASITKSSSLLAHTLYEISSRLLDSSITPAITAAAQEFTELADLAKKLGELLTLLTSGPQNFVTEQLLESSGQELSRLDWLVKAYETEISGFDRGRAPNRFKRLFKEDYLDMTWIFRHVKEPLRVTLSVLKIAQEKQQLSKRSKKKKHPPDFTALTREYELAESWIEASRQVVKKLHGNAKNHLQKMHFSDELQLEDCNEDSAVWLYKIIFNRALSSLPAAERSNARGGYVKTIRTADGNATASDSERDEITDYLPRDLVRELNVTKRLKELVVDELIQTWTGLDPKAIRRLTNSTREKDKNRFEDSVSRIVSWYLRDENSAREDESPRPTHRRSREQSEKGGQYYTHSGGSTDRVGGEEPQGMDWAAEVPLQNLNGDSSRSKLPETGISEPPPYDQPTSEERAKNYIPSKVTVSDSTTKEDNTFKNRPSAPDLHGFASNKPRSQSSKRASNQQNASRVNFEDDDHLLPPRNKEYFNSGGLAPEVHHRRGSRGRHSTHTGVPGDDSYWKNSHHTSSRPTMFSESTNPRGSYGNNFMMGNHHVPNPSIHMSTVPNPLPSGHGLGSIAYHYQMAPLTGDGCFPNHRGHRVVSEDEENSGISKLHQRIDELEKEKKAYEKARRNEEVVRKEEGREKTEEDERKLLEQRQKVASLSQKLQQLQEIGRRNEESWKEEKRALEHRLEAQTISEQQRFTGAALETHTTYRNEDKLWGLVDHLQASERRKEDEWAKEKDRILEEAQEQLKRVAEECGEEKQAEIEGISTQYEERLKIERENVRKAEGRAEHYVSLYNARVAARHEEPATMSESARASQGAPDPFDYCDKHRNSSLGSSVDDGSAIETQTGMEYPGEPQNPWADRSPYDRFAPQDRARRDTASAASRASDEVSNVIVFPPRAGWSDFGPNQLGNYLSSSGFKAMFEERERPVQDAHGRFERIGSGGNVLRGTLFWQPPASTAEADLYKSLRNCGWRPTYVRTAGSGQTWFFGAQPVHAQFFSDMYRPQVTPLNLSRPICGSEKESLIISKDLIEIEELDFLGHKYKIQDGKIFLDPTLTPADIDHIVARSFLAREGKYRKRFRNSSLGFSSPKMDIVEVTSGPEDSASEASSVNKERRLSLWPFWGTWSGQQSG